MKKQATAIASALALIAVLAVSASAQSGYKLRITVPFDFVIGNKTYPAGRYSVGSSSSLEIIQVQSRDSNHTAFVTSTVPIKPAGDENATRLEFNRYGDRYFLSKIWIGGEGRQLPKSRLERDLIENRSEEAELQVETVIVTPN